MRTRSLILSSLIVASVLSISAGQPAMCAKQSASVKPVATSPEASVRSRVADLKNAVISRNAKEASGLWAEDGRYVDEDGSEYVGRAALEKMFESVFSDNAKSQVEIVINKVRFPASNVALVDGMVKRAPAPNAAPIPMNHYSIVLEQKGGVWLIDSAIETPITASGNPAATLANLGWLVGDWTAKRDGGEVRMKAEWVPTKNFIMCTYRISKPGTNELRETQVIGWDPRWQQPISWHFNSNGGFGSGHWINSGGKWMVTSEAVDRRGAKLSALNVISQNGPDSFNWQSVNRRINGVLVEDTQPLKVERAGSSDK